MESFLKYFFMLSAMVAVIIIATHLIHTFTKNKYSIKWKYFVWLILACRLMIPVDFSLKEISVAVLPSMNDTKSNTFKMDGQSDDKKSFFGSEALANKLVHENIAKTEKQNHKNINSYGSMDIKTGYNDPVEKSSKYMKLFIIWLFGVLVFLCIDLIKYFLFKRRLTRWSILINNIQYRKILQDSLNNLNIHKKIDMYVSKTINTPMIAGIIKPAIYIPHEDYNEKDLEIILKHELIHYKRYDLYYKLLLIIVRAIHWFNPLVHFMAIEANKDLEFLCDEEVIKNMDIGYKQKYTQIILELAKKRQKNNTYLVTGFLGGVNTMKKRFSNILNEKQYGKGYKLLVGIILLLMMFSLFISCSKSASNISKVSEESKGYKSKSSNLWELPEKDEELAKRMALRNYGADMPVIEYASENIAIISAYWGIAVYDLKNNRLCRVVDLISIKMSATQGDEYREILVNKEGTQIIIKRDNKDPENFVPNYLYDIEKNKLEATEKDKFGNGADNIFYINDENVKTSLKGINLEGFYYNIAKIGANKWLGLKYADSDSKWVDMRSLVLNVFDSGKSYKKQVFKDYNVLPNWPDESEIIKEHMGFMKAGNVYPQSIGYKGMSEKEVMQEFKKSTDWKYIGKDGELEKYIKKIKGYDVLIGISTARDAQKNETILWVRVY